VSTLTQHRVQSDAARSDGTSGLGPAGACGSSPCRDGFPFPCKSLHSARVSGRAAHHDETRWSKPEVTSPPIGGTQGQGPCTSVDCSAQQDTSAKGAATGGLELEVLLPARTGQLFQLHVDPFRGSLFVPRSTSLPAPVDGPTDRSPSPRLALRSGRLIVCLTTVARRLRM
jgi:hypothetical protein